MKRYIPVILLLIVVSAIGYYYYDQYRIHYFDPLIKRHAEIYRLDPDLVWSVIYEETYFRPSVVGDAGEIGLMQVTPMVGRAWAKETGMRDLERQMASESERVLILRDPERNIQIGCWYLEKLYQDYRDMDGAEARMLAGYNAGQSRVTEWQRTADGAPPLTEAQFVARIDIPSTRAYVGSILQRYRRLKNSKQKPVDGGQSR